jgi:hypothetical protein
VASKYGTIAEIYARIITTGECCALSLREAANMSLVALLELANQAVVEAAKQNIPGKIISALGTNATSLSAVPAKLTYLTLSNDAADEMYVKFYNITTVPNPAVDVPVWSLIVPGRTEGAGSNIPIPKDGVDFTVGLGVLFTTGIADTDATGVAANDVVMNYALEV